MSVKTGLAIVVLATALATTAYAEKKHDNHGGNRGGNHASNNNRHANHGNARTTTRAVSAPVSRAGRHEVRGYAGHWDHRRWYPGFAGAYRNPVYWLYWPFAYYGAPEQLAQTCGEDVADIASLPIDQFGAALHPADALAAALNDLGAAVTQATQVIRTACLPEPALTATGRMAAMQRRIEAMLAAVDLVQPALGKFYGLLNDEQKAKVNALSAAARQVPPGPGPGPRQEGLAEANCGPSPAGAFELPVPQIDRTLQLSDPQRASLAALQSADAQAGAELLKACAGESAGTPTGRLAAAHQRLDAMLTAIKTVSAALNDFYATLSDEQKAKFEAIGPIADAGAPPPAQVRRVYSHPPGLIVRGVRFPF
ncbi:MAG TPA: Spy/CpxP family protein refolding chaperone [Pseudolabrys sp.]|nr:Spy/CpxP family protein refolding chaperone [Pseudolabrys sp.]